MSRPKPEVLLSKYDPNSGKTEQVLAADAIYAVFFDGRPINLKNALSPLNLSGAKYPKSSFSNSGHAFNLAERLNKVFNTDKFQVVKLVQGEVITEDDE